MVGWPMLWMTIYWSIALVFSIDRESLEKLYGDGFDDEALYGEDFDASGDDDDLEDNDGNFFFF